MKHEENHVKRSRNHLEFSESVSSCDHCMSAFAFQATVGGNAFEHNWPDILYNILGTFLAAEGHYFSN